MPVDWPVIRGPLEAYGVTTAEKFAKRHRSQLQALRGRGLPVEERLEPDGAPVIVSGGTWIVVCPCRAGAVASRDWNEARCFDCGRIFRSLTWPADVDAVVEALLARPQGARHWWGDATAQARMTEIFGPGLVGMFGSPTGETVADLQDDNVARGLPADRETGPPTAGQRQAAADRVARRTRRGPGDDDAV
jgi:hypothetical protein